MCSPTTIEKRLHLESSLFRKHYQLLTTHTHFLVKWSQKCSQKFSETCQKMWTTLIYDLPCGWLYCWPFQRLAFPIRLVLQVCNEHYTHLLFWRIGWASTISEIGCCHFGKSNSPLLVAQVLERPSKHQLARNFCLHFWLCMPLSIFCTQNMVLKKKTKKKFFRAVFFFFFVLDWIWSKLW